MTKYIRKPDGTRYHPAYGRIMTHDGYATRIFWSKAMLDYLHRHYATTVNKELAGCLGVSMSTLARKARELGLEKDPAWLATVHEENRRLGQVASRKYGNKGQFKKGGHAYRNGEFGTRPPLTDEQIQRRSESMRRWYRTHPEEARAKCSKAWKTRRGKREEGNSDRVV